MKLGDGITWNLIDYLGSKIKFWGCVIPKKY